MTEDKPSMLSRRRYVQALSTTATVGVGVGRSETVAAGGGDELWTFKTDGTVFSSPTVVDGTVYVGSGDENLYAVDASDGSQEWVFKTDGIVFSSPTVVDGTVYVGSGDENLYAVDASDGSQKWALSGPTQSPTVLDGTVYASGGALSAIDADTGTRDWAFTIPSDDSDQNTTTAPTVVDGTVYVGAWTNIGSVLYAVDAETGTGKWAFTEHTYLVESAPTVVDGTVYFAAADSTLYAVNAESGTQEWAFTGPRGSPTVWNGTVYAGSVDMKSLYAVDAETGEEEWAFTAGDRVRSSPTVADGLVFAGSHDEILYAVDLDDGSVVWSFETDDRIWSSPTVQNGAVYVGSFDENLYAIDAGIEGSSEGSRVLQGVLGHHHNLVHTDQPFSSVSPSDGTVAAEITEVAVPVDEATTGDTVTSLVTVENTGSVEHTFFIGYSVRAPDQTLHDNDGTTGQPVTLPAGGADTVAVEWDISSEVPGGEYDVITAVWEESDRSALETQLAVHTVEPAFELDSTGLPTGSSILPPATPATFPYTDVQELAFDNIGEDRYGVEGDGIRLTVDRILHGDDSLTLSVGIDSPEEGLIGEIGGHRQSQLLVLYDDSELTLDSEELTSRVDGGTPEAVRAAEAVTDLASLVTVGTAGSLVAVVKEGVKALAEEVATDWATSQLAFETPPTITEDENLSVIEIDFSTETIGTSPVTMDEYTFEATFTDVDSDDFPPIMVLADMRGKTEPIYTPADNRITGASLTTHEYPVEYRRQVNVGSATDADSSEESEQEDGIQADLDDTDRSVDDMPGFGITTAVSALGGAGYALKRRLDRTSTDDT